MDATEQRRQLYSGFGETFSRAVEFVATPAIFGIVGHFIDGWAGTGRLFAVLLASLALIGMFLRSWYAYVEAMKSEEAKGAWHRS